MLLLVWLQAKQAERKSGKDREHKVRDRTAITLVLIWTGMRRRRCWAGGGSNPNGLEYEQGPGESYGVRGGKYEEDILFTRSGRRHWSLRHGFESSERKNGSWRKEPSTTLCSAKQSRVMTLASCQAG